MENKLENKKIFITGASRGIGFELVKLLIKTKNHLILSASNENSFNMLKKFLSENEHSAKIDFIALDLSNTDEVFHATKKIQSFGDIDFLINNAGIGIFKKFTDFSVDDFDNIMNINFKSPFLLIQSVLPEMIKNNSGCLINVLSVVAQKPFINSSIYGASKAAFLQMSECLRLEIRDKGIKLINIFPGATATEIWSAGALEKFSDKMMKSKDVAIAIYKVIELTSIESMMVENLQIRPQGGDL